jgi:hypothetical protein
MVDDEEWDWIVEHATEGGFNHLFLATTLPVFLPEGMHWLEAWNEATAQGGWGERMKGPGEWIRQTLDLEHWAAFQNSFHRVVDLVRDVGSGKRGDPPASVVFLSGDVHNAYLAKVEYPKRDNVQMPVWQGVCSPFRNPLDSSEQRAVRMTGSRPVGRLMRQMAKRAGVKDPAVSWKLQAPPAFDNQVSTLEWNGPAAKLKLERAEPGHPKKPPLTLTYEHELTEHPLPAEKSPAGARA